MRSVAVAVGLASVSSLLGQVAAARPASGYLVSVPAQFVAKLSTEGLGRVPDQGGWSADVAVFDAEGCTPGSLEKVGKHVLESPELTRQWAHDAEALAEIAFRAVLNREPDPPGFRALVADIDLHGWDAALSHVFDGGEFASLAGQICSSTSSSYGFNDSTGVAPTGVRGPVPACTTCLGVRSTPAGIDPTESQLRQLASVPGALIVLAPRSVITLTQPLALARNVTLETAGLPGPSRYIDMARLTRDFGTSPGLQHATVVLDGGATLQSVWVSGQRAIWRNAVSQSAEGYSTTRLSSWGQIRDGSDVQVLSGVGTSVLDDRIDDSPGSSSVELLGAESGNLCLDNVVQGNLVEAYSSVHEAAPAQDDVVPWTDGISDHCQSSRVALNQIIDATDVPIILFESPMTDGMNPPQASEVSANVIVSAGNSAYSALAADPGWNPVGAGDPAEGPGSRDFTGAVIGGSVPVPTGGQPTAPGQGNLMWTGPRTHFNAAISDGTTDFYGPMAYDGRGAQVLNNTTGSGWANAAAGIVVSGMMKTRVKGNTLAVTLVQTSPDHIWRCSGAEHAVEWFYPQRASGDVQGHPVAVQIPPPRSPGCIVAGT
ncbi:MAG: hypothetical protein ACYDH6_22925 [Acidimicrobiales bacterium]